MGNIAFIIGSARSGTTILGDILKCHDQIAQWYEPYYLWRRFFSCKEHEVWRYEDCNDRVIRAIQKEHSIFQKKTGKPLVVEKMPSHSFNIPIINEIFPNAKWIHIIRDGRDVTLSMKKEWEKRTHIIQKKDYISSLRTGLKALQRPPFVRYKLMLISYELLSNFSFRPSRYLNKAKWGGEIGWGPRFIDWQVYLQNHSSLEFNAMQWVKTVEAVHRDRDLLSDDSSIEIRYEDLLMFPEKTMKTLFSFLGVEYHPLFLYGIPELKTNNSTKWKKELTREEINKIQPILNEWLHRLGYSI